MTGLRTTVSCFDRLFDKASSNKYYLSVRLEPDGLFYTVFDPDEQRYIGFESFVLSGVSEMYGLIDKHEILRLPYQKSLFIIPSQKYTLIPSPLFIQNKAEEYFSFVHNLESKEQISISSVYNTEAVMVYSSDITWFEIINEFFKNARILPITVTFLHYILPRIRNSSDSLMFINLYHDTFDFLFVRDGKLAFCNNFTYKAPEDIVYYTVFVIDQLKINVDQSELKISGRVNSKQDVLKLLKKYIKSVDILDADKDVRKSYALENINTFNYPDLFNPRLCEL